MQEISGPVIMPQNGKPRHLVIIFHGYGANGHKLISLGEAWQEILPDAVFVAPNAPTVCEKSPLGRQWFSMRDWTVESVKDRLFEISPSITAYIQNLMQHYTITDPACVALVGFSQGAMLALHQGVYGLEKIAGVIGYSGGFIADNRLNRKDPMTGSNTVEQLPKFLIIHGQNDQVVSVQASLMAQDHLQDLGMDVELMLEPDVEHEITQEGFIRGGAFLTEIFKA